MLKAVFVSYSLTGRERGKKFIKYVSIKFKDNTFSVSVKQNSSMHFTSTWRHYVVPW